MVVAAAMWWSLLAQESERASICAPRSRHLPMNVSEKKIIIIIIVVVRSRLSLSLMWWLEIY
jgi:hypothetical protein